MTEPVRCPKCQHRRTEAGRRYCEVCEPAPELDAIIAEVQRLREESKGLSDDDHAEDMFGELLRFLGVETCHLCMDAQMGGDDACYNHTTRSKAI